MSLKEMREKVLEELDYVDKRPRPQQSYLRMAYFVSRMHSLGKKADGKKSAFDVLRECIQSLKSDHPDFDFKYDKAFFRAKTT